MDNKELTQLLMHNSATNVKQCMKCGKCSGRCPAFNEMDIKPHQFISLLAQGKVDKLMESKAIWSCLSCMECVERCPRGVAPAFVIEAVRNSVERMQNGDYLEAEEIPAEVNELIPQQLLVSAFRKYKK